VVAVYSALRRLHTVSCAFEIGYGVLARLRPRAFLARAFRSPLDHLGENGRPAPVPARHCAQPGLARLPRHFRGPAFRPRLLPISHFAPSGRRLLRFDRTAQCVHEVDHIRRRRRFRLALDGHAALLALKHLDDRRLVGRFEDVPGDALGLPA
jgi:hypothetical protein